VQYKSYIESLIERHPGLFADTGLAVLPDSHFGDGSHVNLRGAAQVSRELSQLLVSSVRESRDIIRDFLSRLRFS
jgi:hypothetical protein